MTVAERATLAFLAHRLHGEVAYHPPGTTPQPGYPGPIDCRCELLPAILTRVVAGEPVPEHPLAPTFRAQVRRMAGRPLDKVVRGRHTEGMTTTTDPTPTTPTEPASPWGAILARAHAAGYEQVACGWFALCANAASGTTPHPVLGDVPTCGRCHKFATGASR